MTNDSDQIKALCQRLGRAHHDKDADAIVGCYAPDAAIWTVDQPTPARCDELHAQCIIMPPPMPIMGRTISSATFFWLLSKTA